MEDYLVQQQIKNMLANKIALEGGVLVGGKRRKRKPSAWGKKVKSYMKKYGMSLGEAAHAASKKRGSGYESDDLIGEGRRRRRKKKYGSGSGSKMSSKQLEKILYTPEDRLKQKLAEKKWVKDQLFVSECGKIPRKNATKAQLREYYEKCQKPNLKKAYKAAMKGVLAAPLVTEQARIKEAREKAEETYKDYLTESLASLVSEHK